LSFFGHFFVISVLFVISFVIFLSFFSLSCQFWFVIFLSFGGNFVFLLSFWCNVLKKYAKNIENCLKNDRKMTKNDNASRKMQFLQPAKLPFCLSFFVIWWKICHFFVVVVQFSQKYGEISAID